MTDFLKPEHFEREDETNDGVFYETPRLVTHLDTLAIDALSTYLTSILFHGQDVLDLMSSCVSHLPEDVAYGSVMGLGMNGVELDENIQLTDYCIHNLNTHPELPFEDEQFDVCLISLSVQYLTKPAEVFTDISRVLRPGGKCVVSFSNRLFPSKAVAIWLALGDVDRARLVALYYGLSNAFEEPVFEDLSPSPGESDPIYAVTAERKPG